MTSAILAAFFKLTIVKTMVLTTGWEEGKNKISILPLNADVLEHCRRGMDQIKHFWLSLARLTLSGLQCNLVHQTGGNTLHLLPFSPQTRNISDPLAASVDDTDLLSPVPKQKHHLKHNIIKARMELDHKKKQSKPEE